jgi:flagellar basal body-associated protein FliL
MVIAVIVAVVIVLIIAAGAAVAIWLIRQRDGQSHAEQLGRVMTETIDAQSAVRDIARATKQEMLAVFLAAMRDERRP